MTSPDAQGSAQLIGHQWALDALARAIKTSSLAHAYLLTGPEHVGKLATAMAIARLLLCPSNPACGTCRHCRHAARGAHPDMRILALPTDRKTIPIKDVHEFLHGIALKPLEATRKVYLIPDAENLAEDGATALLKTIEEPPAGVTLLLTAADPSALLPTVVSRCQVITLHRVPPAVIAEHLISGRGIDADRAQSAASESGGLPGWAILAVDRPEILEDRVRCARELRGALDGDVLSRIRYADELSEQWSSHPENVRNVLEIWAEVWEAALLVQHGFQGTRCASAIRREAVMISERLDASTVRRALARTLDVEDGLNHNANPRLALEAYMMGLPRPAGSGLD
ncbi:MAG TPA: hypothetical protein VFC51_09125 [Chloroflexota bacterium]|nr:hypothetical protein [Chloroflexota bacterium]